MAVRRCPLLYQMNTRVRLAELSRELGRRATLDDLPDAEIDRLAKLGFDWVWLLCVWQTGPAGRRVSRENPEWRREFEETLPDLREEDIAGSGFAVTDYRVHPDFGGDAALARLRGRLRERGLRLMLDFVPNHTGLDHPWVNGHPEYYIGGTEADLARAPRNYTRIRGEDRRASPRDVRPSLPRDVRPSLPRDVRPSLPREGDERILAHGRDPHFPGWPDTLQLDYGHPGAQQAMMGELLRIAGQCDGVRCDMAMLLLPEVFERTWGIRPAPFWPEAIRRVRERVPGFCFLAEVYWDLEWTLQQQGFDYTYDKRLYDRLREGRARPVREHLHAGLDYQARMARFLENHDEPRAATAFSPERHEAAAVITFLSPGLRFFHQGQLEGRKKRISPHLGRGPDEPTDLRIARFYEDLLAVLRRPAVRDGEWQLLERAPAWEGNWTWDCFLAFGWQGPGGDRLIVAVNHAPHPSQCYVHIPYPDLAGGAWRLSDLLGPGVYGREGSDLRSRGLYLDMGPWERSVFTLAKMEGEAGR